MSLKPGRITRGKPFPAHEDDDTVRLERDDAAAAHELREAEATEERRHFPRIVERSDRAVVVRERDEHALRAPIGALTRRSRPEAVYRRDARTETPRDVQPVDAFLEERIASCHGLVIAPVVGGFQPERDGHEMPEHHVADSVFGQQAPQADGQWLVVIVLADEDRTPGPIALRDDRDVVLGVEERRLLDQHVLAAGKRLLRQVEMEARRDGYDDGVHGCDPRAPRHSCQRPSGRRTGGGILPPSRDRGWRSSGRSFPTARLSGAGCAPA